MKQIGLTLLGVVALVLAGPAAANRLLGLAQLAGGQGCIAQPEEEAEAVRGCGRGRGLIDPSSVALSRDGKSAYVAGSGSGVRARPGDRKAHAAELRLRERDERRRRNKRGLRRRQRAEWSH